LIRYDGTVRNAVGDVIQFLYGEDGMDGAAIESQKIEALKATEVRRCFGVGMLVMTIARKVGSSNQQSHAHRMRHPLMIFLTSSC
jgi:hypothetical protein